MAVCPLPACFAWYIATSASWTSSLGRDAERGADDADRASDGHVLAVDEHRLGDAVPHPVGDAQRLGVVGHVTGQHDELVAGESEHDVVGAHGFTQSRRRR